MREVLEWQPRQEGTKGDLRVLRQSGRVPCVVYGDAKEPVMGAIDQKALLKLHGRADFYNNVLELKAEGETVLALPKEVQYHPVTDMPLHIDFMRVSATSEIKIHIPVEFVNEDKSPAIKLGAILNVVQRTVEIWCSPLSIPEQFEIDLAGAQLGATFTVKDLNIPEGCRLGKAVSSTTVLANIVKAGGADETEASATTESAAS